MEVWGEWRRRLPHGSSTSDDRTVFSEWASLLPDLVQGIADCVLTTTGGVEAYMNMRAVCPSWRSAISRPSPLAAVADLRFRPRHWVMVDLNFKDNDDDNDGRLFLHFPTGRFRHLRLPVLRENIIVGATDGLLVLGDREPPHLARVLNPFTGDMVHFVAPLLPYFQRIRYTALNGGSPLTLGLWKWYRVFLAASTSDVFIEERSDTCLLSMVTFQGNIYCADPEGRVYKYLPEQCEDDLVVIAQVLPDVDVYSGGYDGRLYYYLVESAGELLLIRHLGRALKVFRVNMEHKLLEEVKTLGGRQALFLGDERCISVDAGMLPSVDPDCIYMFNRVENSEYEAYVACVYDLRDHTVEIISKEDHLDRPFSLVQVLLRYCDFRSKSMGL